MRLGLLILAPALFLGACGVQPELRALREMPTVTEAVVAPGNGRLLPSASGPPGAITIPEEVFALSGVLAEVRTEMSNQSARTTIAPGDLVEILVFHEGDGSLNLVRTPSDTYCWVAGAALDRSGG
ncbi:MAG: hypothetical protein DRJ65_21590 [Acidobacteria bacterium]|nr:MAG: hypothetical protein DRJ65_21590 [Acidobacteriota bacterium]